MGKVSVVLVGALVVGGLVALDFAGESYGVFKTGFFAPKYEAIRRDVAIQSRAYTEAEVRRLYDLKLQYIRATSDQEKQTIVLTIRHEVTAFDRDRIPVDLVSWMTAVGAML